MKIPQEVHKCEGKVHGDYRDVSGRVYPCSRKGTVERDGKWYCWQHDPERVRADKEKREGKWKTEQDIKTRRWKRRGAMTRVCKGVSTADLEKLEVGAVRRLLSSLHRKTP